MPTLNKFLKKLLFVLLVSLCDLLRIQFEIVMLPTFNMAFETIVKLIVLWLGFAVYAISILRDTILSLVWDASAVCTHLAFSSSMLLRTEWTRFCFLLCSLVFEARVTQSKFDLIFGLATVSTFLGLLLSFYFICFCLFLQQLLLFFRIVFKT